MTLGLASGHVLLAREHDAWATDFEIEQAKILAAVGKYIVSVEHVGSTSVPHLPAKPILDIMVGVQDFDEARVCVAGLAGIGYAYRGENGIPRRRYFVKGEPRTHHVHMIEIQSEDWRSALAFRDLLRANPGIAREYEREKVRLARRYPNDRRSYQRGKDKAVEKILSNAIC